MSRYSAPLTAPSLRARETAENLAREAGRLGAARLPDEALVHVGPDPSDTVTHSLMQAFEAGQLQRRPK